MTDCAGTDNQADNKTSYETLLMEYACGVLCDELSLAVSAHLSLAPEARRMVAMYERLGGTLMQQECEPVALCADALRAVMDRLDCPRTAAACNPPRAEYSPPPGFDDMPPALCRFLAQRGHAHVRWRSIYPGIRAIGLSAGRGGPYSALIRMAPGRRAPGHRHHGRELTLVLDGALRDGDGVYTRGTLLVLEGGDHAPAADKDCGCVCLIVSEAPVIPSQHIGRLLARYFSN